MSVSIIPVDQQARGEFDNGTILETKPIGFPQDGGSTKPYSNLFYWAYAWTPGAAGLIDEHPHRGFEIMTFVLKGRIEHYDSKNADWRRLNAGDVQIIRAGSGITHAERILEESAMFQIWMDPDLSKTLSQPASYDDYRSESFPVANETGRATRTYRGDGAPIEMTTPGVVIKGIQFDAGEHELVITSGAILSLSVLAGQIDVDEGQVPEQGFLIIKNRESLPLKSNASCRVFTIESPAQPGYVTYAQRFNP